MAEQARLLELQREYSKAAEVMERALELNPTKRDKAILNYKIGLNLSLAGAPRSEHFYSQSVMMATENGDTAMACEFLRNYADYLANNGKYRQSNNVYREISRMMPQMAGLSAIQMAMAGNYINLPCPTLRASATKRP